MRWLFLAAFLSASHSVEPSWHARIAADDRPGLSLDEFAPYDSGSDIARSFERPFSREDAFEILLKTRVFAMVIDGGPPISGPLQASPQSVAFGVLCEERDARALFLDLIERAHRAGQLYGLCGLYLVDRQEFTEQLPRYSNDETKVYFANGCIHSFSEVSGIVRSDEGHEDIVGGEIPSELEGAHKGFFH